MANTLKLQSKIILKTKMVFEFLCTLSGSYANGGAVGTPGETLNFNGATNPNYIARPRIPSVLNGSLSQLPATADIEVCNSPGGFIAVIERNAVAPTAANFAMRIFVGGSASAQPAELASGTYAANATAIINEPFVIQITVPLKYN